MHLAITRYAVAAGILFAGFQTPGAPPMKMGLWEQTAVNTITHGGAQPVTETRKSRSCFTAETWTTLLARAENSCTIGNQSFGGPHYTLDISCEKSGMKIHMDGLFPTPESGQGTSHTTVDNAQVHMVADAKYDMHFVSSDCGTVQPGKTEIVR